MIWFDNKMVNKIVCNECSNEIEINDNTYFCPECGSYLKKDKVDPELYCEYEKLMKRIKKNYRSIPHKKLTFDEHIDRISLKLEKIQSLYSMSIFSNKNEKINKKISNLLEICQSHEFIVAFVGVIKTGKSTLINSLLGHEYASWAVDPETAALTKFKYSPENYITVKFYNMDEWEEFWKDTEKSPHFRNEYTNMDGNSFKKKFIGHDDITIKIESGKEDDIKSELHKWSSCQEVNHFFVKEIEVGLSDLPEEFPRNITIVDTPGLSDPVPYRSKLTIDYIHKANSVFVCIEANKISGQEVETLSSVFANAGKQREKVYLIGTHWDKLNKPESDWMQHHTYLVNLLKGEAFFKNEETARSNITYSSAYNYNLLLSLGKNKLDEAFLSDPKKLEIVTNLWTFVNHISLVNSVVNNISAVTYFNEMGNREIVKKKTNIDFILSDLLNLKIARRSRELLLIEIQEKLQNINFDVSRVANDVFKSINQEISIFRNGISDLEESKRKVKNQYAETKRNYELLNKYLRNVREKTKSLLRTLDKKIKS